MSLMELSPLSISPSCKTILSSRFNGDCVSCEWLLVIGLIGLGQLTILERSSVLREG